MLAAILADGTNLGVERMANASQGVTYAQLAWTQNWYISPENYESALAQIVREQHRLLFGQNWGDGTSASSDGQFFRTGRNRAGAAEVNAKYGHECQRRSKSRPLGGVKPGHLIRVLASAGRA